MPTIVSACHLRYDKFNFKSCKSDEAALKTIGKNNQWKKKNQTKKQQRQEKTKK